jgi:rhodanese-related sulfurtransferase
MLHRRFLMLGAVAAAVGAGVILRPRASYAGENISAPQAHERATSGILTLIDIRRPDEWQATGVGVGAHTVDMRGDDFTDTVLALVQGDMNAAIALICARGVRSARLSSKLSAAGFGQIINVPEGMLGASEGPGWIARGLPLRRV